MGAAKSFSRYLNRHKLHAVALSEEQPNGRIFFDSGEARIDVTEAHALITLNPFAIAVNGSIIDFRRNKNPTLLVLDDGIIIGKLLLRQVRTEHAGDLVLHIYESDFPAAEFSFLQRIWYAWLLSIKNKTNRRARHFVVPPEELLKLFVYTLKPRPVYLVSVAHQKGFDVFPIDIFGQVADDLRVISVRTTSPVIRYILETGNLCAASVPFYSKETVYRFGGHHAGGVLPEPLHDVRFMESPLLRMPVPDFAVSVQELHVRHSFTQGIHTQFVAQVMHHYRMSHAPLLAHTPWFNEKYFQGKFDGIR
jgi:flavin reductase (DIM6/NTAB) family NADH-FMN oxidoreductase RutF